MMKVSFVYTDVPDIRSLPKDDIYTRIFEFPDAALQISDCQEHILQIARTLSNFTSACVSITCNELKLKNYPISVKPQDGHRSIRHNFRTIVLVFENTSKRFRPERRKLQILGLDFNIRLVSQSYYAAFRRRSLERGLLCDVGSWASGEGEYPHRKQLLTVVEPLLMLLNADPSQQWRFLGFHPDWSDNSLITRMNKRGQRALKEMKRKEREAKKIAVTQEKEAARSRPKEEFVYFIQAGDNGAIKIGTTKDLKKRIASLSTGTSEELRVLKIIKGNKALEITLHDKFASLRKRGEWFEPAQELLDYIGSLDEILLE